MKCSVQIFAYVIASLAMADAAWCAPANPTTFLRVFLFGSKDDGSVREVASVLEARDYSCRGRIDVNAITYHCSVILKYRGPTERDFGITLTVPSIPFTQAELRIQSERQKDVSLAYEPGTTLRHTFRPGTEVRFDATYSGTDTIYKTIGDFGIEEFPVMYSDSYESTPVALDTCRVTFSVSEQFRASVAYSKDELDVMETFSFRAVDHASEYGVTMRGKCPGVFFDNPVHIPLPEGLRP